MSNRNIKNNIIYTSTFKSPLYTVAYVPDPKVLSNMTLLDCGKLSLDCFRKRGDTDVLFVAITAITRLPVRPRP